MFLVYFIGKNVGSITTKNLDKNKESVLSKQIALAYASFSNTIIATFINAGVLIIVLWPEVEHENLFIWLIAISIVSLTRALIAYNYHKKNEISPEQIPIWYRRFITGTILAAMVWGSSAVFLFPSDDIVRQVFLAFILGGMSAGAIASLSSIKMAIYPFLCITLSPLIIRFFISDAELALAEGGMLTLYFVMLLFTAKRTHLTIQDNIHLQIENTERALSLEQSENRYQTLLETATDAFFLHDMEGRFVDVNLLACRNLGYTRDELLNMSVLDIEIGDAPDKLKLLTSDLQEGKSIHLDGIHRRKDGSTFPVEISAGLIKMNNQKLLSVLARDVSERKETERQLLAKTNQLQTVISNAAIVLWAYDTNGIFTFSEGRALKDLGLKPGQVVGQSVFELYADYPDIIEASKCALSGKSLALETLVNERYYETFYTPRFDSQGEIQGCIGVAVDISERKQAELGLIKAVDEANYANQAKSKFLSNMSHELRTPLNAILGFSQLLSMTIEDDEQNECVLEITKDGKHLLSLVNEILDLEKIESGNESCSLNDIIEESISLIQPLVNNRNILLVNNIPLKTNYLIYVDSMRFKQTLLNLLSNAVKYNIREGTITISCDILKNNRLRVNISDTGHGLSEQQQKLLFKPFERMDEHKAIGGTGIGLSISKNLIELMDGKIGVESQKGKGSTFWLEVNMHQNEEDNL